MIPIYYQYLNGEKRGEITTLKYIDDTFPGGVMYYFEDGFKCFDQVIGEYGDKNAFKEGKVLVRIQSINKKWSFKENEIREVAQKAYSDDAQMEFEIPDPYFVDKSGKRLHDSVLKSSVDAYPPSFTCKKDVLEIPEEYYTSWKKDQTSKKVEAIEEETSDTDFEVMSENDDYFNRTEAIASSDNTLFIPQHIENPKQEITLDYNGDYSNCSVTISNATGKNPHHKILSDIPVKDLLDAYLFGNQADKDETVSDAMVLLTDSCKKILTPIDMSLEIELPNKSFYNMISENYGDSSFDECITHIINNLDISIIKDAIKNALIKSYKGEEIE